MSEGDLLARIQAELAEIEKTRMPFGRYGPEHYPNGVPIYDLPAEYLSYFSKVGWPKGKLGELLKIVYQMKVDGSDCAFELMRQRAGGRTQLRKPAPKVNIRFRD